MLPILLAQAEELTVEALPSVSVDLGNAVAATAAGGAVLGGLALLWGALGLVGLVFFIWWIVLLVDLLNRDFPQRSTYLILMIIAFFVAGMMPIMDLVYYFAIVKKGVGTKKGKTPAAPAAPAAPPATPAK